MSDDWSPYSPPRLTIAQFRERYPGFGVPWGAMDEPFWDRLWRERAAQLEPGSPAMRGYTVRIWDEEKLAQMHALALLEQLDAPLEPNEFRDYMQKEVTGALRHFIGGPMTPDVRTAAKAAVLRQLESMRQQGDVSDYEVTTEADGVTLRLDLRVVTPQTTMRLESGEVAHNPSLTYGMKVSL